MHLHNLGTSFLSRFENFGEIKDEQHAANAFLTSSHSQNGNPITRMEASLQYARIMHLRKDFSMASEGYIQAVHLLPQVVWIGLGVLSQLKRFSSDIRSLGCDAAACMFSRAESQHNHEKQHLGHAVEILDQTRSVLWSQASSLRQDLKNLRVVEPRLAEELDFLGRTLGQSYFHNPETMLSEIEEQNHRRCAEKWEELVLSVRKLPGFDHFLLPLSISKLREAAKGGPVAIINISNVTHATPGALPPRRSQVLGRPAPVSRRRHRPLLTHVAINEADLDDGRFWVPRYHLPDPIPCLAINKAQIVFIPNFVSPVPLPQNSSFAFEISI